jgi:hypothetical protein
MNRSYCEDRQMQIVNMQHDEAFLSLLSSQRELLNQLNMGNMMRRAEQAPVEDQPRTEGGGGGSLLAPEARGLTNMSIAERRSSMDMLFTMSKRFSMGGMGYDQSQGTYPSYTGDLYQGEADGRNFDDRDVASTKYKMREKADAHQDEPHTQHKKKRRLSSLGFISSSFFEDHLKEARRDSTDFLSQPSVDDMPNDPHDDDSVHLENDEDDDEEREQDAVSLEPFGMTEHSKSPAEVKSVMQGFTSAMEVSQKSQQDIHDWDKKMGLKRSHSKTMRLSARSRKKLRATFKKEMNALTSKK